MTLEEFERPRLELLARVAATPSNLTDGYQTEVNAMVGPELQRNALDYIDRANIWGELTDSEADILKAEVSRPTTTDDQRRAIFVFAHGRYHSHFYADVVPPGD